MSVQEKQLGEIRVTFPNLPDGGSVHQIGGPLAEEFERLTLFMEDLFAAKIFADRAYADGDTDLREALLLAGLLKFLRCFESTGGLRIKPLKMSKIFAPEDRASMKLLVWTRNKFAVHDEQTHPANSSALLFDKNGKAIDVMTISGLARFQTFAVSAELPRLIDIALNYVQSAHFVAGNAIIADWNAQPHAKKRAVVDGNREIAITLLREDGDETPKDKNAFSRQLEYYIPEEKLPI